MPWCEKCKMEYRDGIKVCADCNTELVDELPVENRMSVIGSLEEEEAVKRLLEFLHYSQVETAVSEYDEEHAIWNVSVSEKEEKQGKKLLHAFYTVESENKEKNQQTESSEEEPALPHPEEAVLEAPEDVMEKTRKLRTAASSTYVKKQEQYTDLKFTAFIFIGFGFAGIAFILLNLVTPIDFLNNVLSLVILSGMVIGFLVVGFSSLKKSGVVKNQIGEESSTTEEINRFLKEHVTQTFLAEHHDDSLSEEINFLHTSELMKELIVAEFGNLNDSYVDQLVEEHYDSLLETE